jgi:dTDP-4-amino-4,6-dideoxygalactose transaminase
VEELITPKTTGILAVHLWGGVCDTAALEAIAHRHGLRLLFDAAHALGCSREGRMVGGFGDAEVFSFHATKFINSFEGGAVVTNDDALAEHLRKMRNFGFVGYDEVDCLGTNGKMTEVAAAMGLTSLENMDEFVSVNRRNHKQYDLSLEGIPGVKLLQHDDAKGASNYQYVVLEIDETVAGLSRDSFHRLLQAENVFARRYFYPGCHRMEPYRSLYPNAGALLPGTERLCRRVLTLPTGTAVQSSEIEMICGMIRFAIENAAALAGQMETLRAAGRPRTK